eukprot:c12625_g1_i1.p1 GENE.c12625_g1_i1~~c12625_g1_i1.p1  ORF type:complete len:520 (-),score=183.36 c12625_g1_i1:31-1569(-)
MLGKKFLEKNVLFGSICGAAVVGLIFLMMGIHYEEVDPLVGSLWSAAVIRETALGTYRVWESSDFKGGDIAFVETQNLEQCLFACDENKDCMYVVLVGLQCYLKDVPTRFDTFSNRPNLIAAKRVQLKAIVGSQYHDAEVKETAKSTYRFWKGQQLEGKTINVLTQSTFDACLSSCDNSPDCLYVSYDGLNCHILEDARKSQKQGLSPQAACAVRVRMKEAPDPLVKHNWAKGETKETNDSVYQTWSGCQFVGGDIIAVKAKNLEDCLDKCDRELFCNRVTLIEKECFLKGLSVQYFEVLSGRSDIWAAQRVVSKKGEEENFYLMVGSVETMGDLHDDALIGKVYDEGINQETKFYRYHVWSGFSFLGGDLKEKTEELTTITVQTCLELCDATPDCSFVNVIVGSQCQLKRRPYDFIRSLDTQSGDVAALKLGRIGKKGLDAKTTTKQDSRAISKQNPIQLARLNRESNQDPTDAKGKSNSFYAFIGFSVLAACVYAYYKKEQNRRFYANEL